MTPSQTAPSRADLIYAMVFAGALGAGVIASVFLILDTLAGRPLHTPLIMGAALITGALPAQTGPIRLDLVALYSLVHLVVFTVVGGLFALLAARLRDRSDLGAVTGIALFTTFMAGLLVADGALAVPIIETIGLIPIMIGNAAAAGAMAWFYVRVFTYDESRIPLPNTLIGDSSS